MKFVIAMTDIEGAWDGLPAEEQKRILARHEEFARDLKAAGSFVEVLHFHPRSEARTVRMDASGHRATAEGPFSDAQEYIGGFYVIEAESLEEAAKWARKGRFMIGANEVRQVWG
jgi:hypothetical protein